MQTYPERPTPSQPAVPNIPQREKTKPQPPKTEMYTLSGERYEKAIAFSRAEYVLYFVSYLLGVFVLIVILRFGIAAKIRSFAERKTPNHWLQGLIVIPLLFGVLDLCSLPIHLYGHSLSLRFEQSVEGWAPWFWDWTKSELLGIGAAILMVMVLFRVMRWSPRRWWFFFWVAALPILLFIFFISPWFVDPLFNTFHPLGEKYPALAADIERVVQRTGTRHSGRPYVFDGCEQKDERRQRVRHRIRRVEAHRRVGHDGAEADHRRDNVYFWPRGRTLRPKSHPQWIYVFRGRIAGCAFRRISRAELGAGEVGTQMGNRGAGRLGVTGSDAADSRNSYFYFDADRKRLQPDAGTQRRCVRARSDSRNCAERAGSGRALVSDFGRDWIGRSEPAGAHYVLALFASAAGAAARVRAYVRSVVEG